jgi:hypothetical protein
MSYDIILEVIVRAENGFNGLAIHGDKLVMYSWHPFAKVRIEAEMPCPEWLKQQVISTDYYDLL